MTVLSFKDTIKKYEEILKANPNHALLLDGDDDCYAFLSCGEVIGSNGLPVKENVDNFFDFCSSSYDAKRGCWVCSTSVESFLESIENPVLATYS